MLSAQTNRNLSWFDRDKQDEELSVTDGHFGSQGPHTVSPEELHGLCWGSQSSSRPLPTAMLAPHPATGRSALQGSDTVSSKWASFVSSLYHV